MDLALPARWSERCQQRDKFTRPPQLPGRRRRLQLHALTYNIANVMQTRALPKAVEHWSLTNIREKRVKIDAKIARHGRYVTFQLAEVAVPRDLFREILRLIDGLWRSPRHQIDAVRRQRRLRKERCVRMKKNQHQSGVRGAFTSVSGAEKGQSWCHFLSGLSTQSLTAPGERRLPRSFQHPAGRWPSSPSFASSTS